MLKIQIIRVPLSERQDSLLPVVTAAALEFMEGYFVSNPT
jgi:hypothetical protein